MNEANFRPRYIDIHSHVFFKDFNEDRLLVLERMRENGIATITVGTDLESSKAAILLSEQNPQMWATVGLHPADVSSKEAEEQALIDAAELEILAKNDKVVAIGECGLDYFHVSLDDAKNQRSVFESQINLANSVNKPLMLHVRNEKGVSTPNAYADALDILKSTSKVRANFHFFAGNLESLKAILDMNYTVSFTGVLTFTRDYDELVKYAPKTHIMVETDCPFVSPMPYRGKRNEPSYVVQIAKAVAAIRGEDEESVRKQLLINAEQFFGISLS